MAVTMTAVAPYTIGCTTMKLLRIRNKRKRKIDYAKKYCSLKWREKKRAFTSKFKLHKNEENKKSMKEVAWKGIKTFFLILHVSSHLTFSLIFGFLSEQASERSKESHWRFVAFIFFCVLNNAFFLNKIDSCERWLNYSMWLWKLMNALIWNDEKKHYFLFSICTKAITLKFSSRCVTFTKLIAATVEKKTS